MKRRPREQRQNFRIRIPGGVARLRTDTGSRDSLIWDIALGGIALDALLEEEVGVVAAVELHWPALGTARATARVVRLDEGTGRTALRFVESSRGVRDLVSALARWPVENVDDDAPAGER